MVADVFVVGAVTRRSHGSHESRNRPHGPERAMRLPIDTSRLKFLVVAPAEPLRQYEEGKPREAWAPRTDLNGEVLWRVQLVALGDGEAEIIRVAVPGDPNVAQGEMVALD